MYFFSTSKVGIFFKFLFKIYLKEKLYHKVLRKSLCVFCEIAFEALLLSLRAMPQSFTKLNYVNLCVFCASLCLLCNNFQSNSSLCKLYHKVSRKFLCVFCVITFKVYLKGKLYHKVSQRVHEVSQS